MKLFLVALIIIGFSVCAWGDDLTDPENIPYTLNSVTSDIMSYEAPEHEFVLHADTGIITLDGKPIETLDTPEIRDALKSIAVSMGRIDGMGIQLSEQADHLLNELDQCRKALEALKNE